MRKTLKAAGLAGALVLSTGARPAGAAEASVVEQLAKNAHYWQERGRDDKASEAWEKVLVADPQNADALAAMAVASAHAGRAEEARDYLSRLKKAHPHAPDLAALEHTIKLGKKYDQLLADARALVHAGKPDEALGKYREAFGSSTPPRALALEYWQTLGGTQSGWEPARDGLQQLVQTYPNEPRYQLALAKHLTYREASRVEGIQLLARLATSSSAKHEAQVAWKQALQWMPVVPTSDPLFAEYLKAVPGDADIAKRQAEIKKADNRVTAVQQGFEALDRSDVKEADKLFKDAGGEPEALVGQAIVAMRREEFEKARVLLERVKQLAPDKPAMWAHALRSATFWSLMRQAKIARDARKNEVAESKLLEASRVSPDERIHAETALADLYLSEQDYAKAEPRLRTVLEAQPGNADALRAMVTLLMHTGRGAEARTANERLAKLEPKKAYSTTWLTAEELRSKAADDKAAGKFDEARATLLAAKDADPTNVWVLHDLANIDMETGELNEAAIVTQKLVELQPNLPEAKATKARLLAQQNKTAAALETLNTLKGDQLTPDLLALKQKLEFQIEVDRVIAQAAHNKRSVARQDLLILERRSQDKPENVAIIALAWSDLGEFDRAISLMQDAMAKVQTPPASMRLQLASILLRSGDEASLAATLDQLNNDPSLNPQERLGLTNLRVAHGVRRADQLREEGELPLAFSQLNPLLQEYPENPKLLCALGRLFEAQDNYADANAVFRRVLESNPGDTEAREGAVNTAFRMGDRAAARRIAEDGVAYAPRDPKMYLLLGRYWLQMDDDASAMNALEQAQALADAAAAKGTIDTEDGLTRPALRTISYRGALTERSSTSAILRKASAQFGGRAEPAEEAGASAQLGLQDEIQQELDRVRARHRVELEGHVETRIRQGESGLGALTELRLPVIASVPLAYTGRFTFQVTPVILDAGALALSNLDIAQRFGSGTTAQTTGNDVPQGAQGTELRLGYRYKGLGLDVGTTPLGFQLKTVTAGIEWRQQFGMFGIAAEASRRAVTDSVLSYAGATDPTTGITWGGVVKEGGRLDLAILTTQATYYVFGDFRYLTGTNVPDNRAVTAGAGVEWKLYNWGEQNLVTGANVVGLGYQKNLSYFTLGNAGYFSPQAFAHVGIPFRWQKSGKLQFDVTAEPGVNWFRQDAAPYFPLDPVRQAAREEAINTDGTPVQALYPSQSSVGFAFNLKGHVSYELTDNLKGGLELNYHAATDYQELFAALQVQFDFSTKHRQGQLGDGE